MTLRAAPTFWLMLLMLLASAPALVGPAAAQARDDDAIVYTVRKGDTLIALARDYMLRETDWKEVQRINRVADPYKLPIASQLSLPIRLLRSRPASATIAAFRGQALASVANAPLRSVAMGQALGEGARVTTGPASSLSLSLTDGSVITLPSNSALRIGRLRKLLITDSIDYDLTLETGSARTRVTPFRNRDDRFRLRNPIAVSAVRGTDFRTHFDAGTETSRSELIEGGSALTTGSAKDTQLAPEFGAVIGKTGAIAVEPLLPAPQLVGGAGVQRAPMVAFAVQPVAGAEAYRLQIGRDSGFVDIVEDVSGNSLDFAVPSLENGRYFARFTRLPHRASKACPAPLPSGGGWPPPPSRPCPARTAMSSAG